MTVYLMQRGFEGPIKIGRSGNAKKRRSDLQTAMPEDLKILVQYHVPDDEQFEDFLHNLFDEHCIAKPREWYRPVNEILLWTKPKAGKILHFLLETERKRLNAKHREDICRIEKRFQEKHQEQIEQYQSALLILLIRDGHDEFWKTMYYDGFGLEWGTCILPSPPPLPDLKELLPRNKPTLLGMPLDQVRRKMKAVSHAR